MSLGDVGPREVGPAWVRGNLAVGRDCLPLNPKSGLKSRIFGGRRFSWITVGWAWLRPCSKVTPLLCRLAYVSGRVNSANKHRHWKTDGGKNSTKNIKFENGFCNKHTSLLTSG